jgi:hypothetical protein
MTKIIIEVAEDAVGWFHGLVAIMQHNLGADVVSMRVVGNIDKGDRTAPRKQYRAVAGEDALEAIGSTTLMGLIYSDILEHNPTTVRDIRGRFPATSNKGVQSVVWKLRHSGFVEEEAIQ